MTTDALEKLYAEAVADVESGAAATRNCGTTQECRLMTGCIRCAGILSGEVGIEHVEIFPGDNEMGILRITTTGTHRSPNACVVSFKVPMTIRKIHNNR
jgi:hypothetical protein